MMESPHPGEGTAMHSPAIVRNSPATSAPRRVSRALAALAAITALVLAPLAAAPAMADEPITAVIAPAEASVTGSFLAGSDVTAETGVWTPADATLTYEWWHNATPYQAPVEGVDQNAGAAVIAGAESAQLTLGADLAGEYVWAVVTGSSGELTPASVVAAGTTAVALPEIPGVPNVSITGTATVGKVLTASLSGELPALTTVSYAWRRNGTAFGPAGSTYTAVAADAGASLSVVATFTRDGYATATRTSTAVVIGKGTISPVPLASMSGAVRVESPVTAVPGAWPAGTTFTYSWRIVDSKGVETISKTTGPVYTPGASLLGRKLSVLITGTAPGHNPATSARSAAVTIAPGVFTAAPTPKIVGSSYVGATLKVSVGTWSPTATLSYRWKRNGVSISGATGTSYKLTSYDYGKKITVTVGARRTGFTTISKTSASTATVTKPFTTTTAPKISGTARSGSTLTAIIGTWSPTPTYTYQWKRNGVAVAGKTAKTYVLSSADIGAKMTVTVTYKRSGYYTRVLTTAATSTVAAPNTMTREGGFKVGVQIAPGTYYSSNTGSAGNNCWFERRVDDNYGVEEGALGYQYLYGENFGGQKVVTIQSTDKYFYTEDCGTWKPVATALRTSVGDGTWVVGKQIKPGTWRTTGPFASDGCYVEYLGSFTGDSDTDYLDGELIEDSPYEVEIFVTDKGFTTDGCGTWKRVRD